MGVFLGFLIMKVTMSATALQFYASRSLSNLKNDSESRQKEKGYFWKQKMVLPVQRRIAYLVPIHQAMIRGVKGPKRRICGSQDMKNSEMTRNQ